MNTRTLFKKFTEEKEKWNPKGITVSYFKDKMSLSYTDSEKHCLTVYCDEEGQRYKKDNVTGDNIYTNNLTMITYKENRYSKEKEVPAKEEILPDTLKPVYAYLSRFLLQEVGKEDFEKGVELEKQRTQEEENQSFHNVVATVEEHMEEEDEMEMDL